MKRNDPRPTTTADPKRNKTTHRHDRGPNRLNYYLRKAPIPKDGEVEEILAQAYLAWKNRQLPEGWDE